MTGSSGAGLPVAARWVDPTAVDAVARRCRRDAADAHRWGRQLADGAGAVPAATGTAAIGTAAVGTAAVGSDAAPELRALLGAVDAALTGQGHALARAAAALDHVAAYAAGAVADYAVAEHAAAGRWRGAAGLPPEPTA